MTGLMLYPTIQEVEKALVSALLLSLITLIHNGFAKCSITKNERLRGLTEKKDVEDDVREYLRDFVKWFGGGSRARRFSDYLSTRMLGLSLLSS